MLIFLLAMSGKKKSNKKIQKQKKKNNKNVSKNFSRDIMLISLFNLGVNSEYMFDLSQKTY